MHKLRKLYLHNSIIQFLISYILILIIPLFAVWYGFQSAFRIVESDIRESNLAMLSHSMVLIDGEMNALSTMALQTSQNNSVKAYAAYSDIETGYIMDALGALDEVWDITRFNDNSVLEYSYIYFNRRNMFMYENTFYRMDIFKRYINGWGLSMEEWRDICANNGNKSPAFHAAPNQKLQLVTPISNGLYGENLGTIVYQVNDSILKELLDYSEKYENYSVFLLDGDNQILWSDDNQNYAWQLGELDYGESGFERKNGNNFIYTTSPVLGWKYIVAVPEKDAVSRLNVLEQMVFALIGISIAIGVFASLILAIRKGKPINEMWKAIGASGDHTNNYNKLGEVVTAILSEQKDLLVELEHDKPLLQKAFFHDLIKAEFLNITQLELAALKAGITLGNHSYVAASFKIFPNNDFYQVDEQTLDEVKIITQLLNNHISETYHNCVWFYKRDYLTTNVIFSVEDDIELCKVFVEQSNHWINDQYEVEVNWGISNICKELLLLWKAAEEADTAMNHCTGNTHIVEYSTDLEDVNEYYFPDIAQERLAANIQAGDRNGTTKILEILEQENFVIRRLSRSPFMKFNRIITEFLSSLAIVCIDGKEQILWLNEMVIGSENNHQEYFNRLKQICLIMCQKAGEHKNQQKNQLIDSIMNYIMENYMDSNLCLAKVGTIFRISEGYLSSVFKEQSGVNFGDYLESIRIEKACQLLKNEKNTVNSIAGLVGYNSVQSFRRAFKRVKGISPKEARL